MLRKVYRFKTAPNSPWEEGSTLHPWEWYVGKFFDQFPAGELEWLYDSVGGRIVLRK